MRAPKRKRPLLRRVVARPTDRDPKAIARCARYVGSPEHKSQVSFAGQPRPRSDASLCPPELRGPRKLTRWLRKAIRAGHVGELWEGDFPRYVWYRSGDIVFEARLTNRENGEYKGYPLTPEEAQELRLDG